MSFIRMKRAPQPPKRKHEGPGDRASERAAQCDGKRPHESYSVAATALRHISGRGSLAKNNIYKCRFCQQWHIGQKKD